MASENTEDIKSGEQRIAWARAHMPVVVGLGQEFAQSRPFDGLKIGICLHVEAKTAVWLEALCAGGALIAITGSPGSTQNDTAAALNAHPRITVFGHREESFDDHLNWCRKILDWGPDLIADNGADLHALIANDETYKELQTSVRGATEETTTGGFRLREDLKSLPFPTWIINDTQAKRIVENRYGVGSSVVDGLMRATNVMLHGKRAVVIGYGYCGSGVAQRLRGLGAHVVVVERDPLIRLEAHLEGFATADLEKALSTADIVITVTGRDGILNDESFQRLADGCLIANAGHFASEIDVAGLRAGARVVSRIRDHVERFEMKDGRALYLLCNANPVNLVAGDGNPIEVMDLGLALQSLSLAQLAQRPRDVPAGPQPVPVTIEQNVAERCLRAWVK